MKYFRLVGTCQKYSDRDFRDPAGSAHGVDAWDIRASVNSSMDKFLPRLTPDRRDVLYERWRKAVNVSNYWGDGNRQEDETGRPIVSSRRSHSVTEKEQRLRASVPFTIFAFTSFLVWKIACTRSQST